MSTCVFHHPVNLVTHPWIPVVGLDGKGRLACLQDVFRDGGSLADLSLQPQDRISVLNLLICVAQRSLDGPKGRADHAACREHIGPAALDYLARPEISRCFELLGGGPRFLQIHGKGNPGTVSLGKLGGVDENGSLLFQPSMTAETPRDPAWVALRLLAFQNYAPGGKVGGAEMQGSRLAPVSGSAGPRRDMNSVHGFLRGSDLLATIWANLVPLDALPAGQDFGQPTWELLGRLAEPFLHRIPEEDSGNRSYLGRLVPLSRAIWVDEGLTQCELTVGIEYPGFTLGVRDPSVTVRTSRSRQGQESLALVGCARGGEMQQVWREIPAVLAVGSPGAQERGPLAFSGAGCVENAGEMVDIWMGGVGGDQANTIDFFESSYRVPAGVLRDDSQHAVWRRAFESGVAKADGKLSEVQFKIDLWCGHAFPGSGPKEIARISRSRKTDAARHFWSILQKHHGMLVEEANAALLSPAKTLDASDGAPWPRLVDKTAEEAFAAVCPSTGRCQLRATALARTGRRPQKKC